MKTKNKLIAMVAGTLILASCKDSFLVQPPQGVYSEEALSNKKGVNGMLINAYATLDGQEGTWYAGASNWLWGSILGADSYKGSEASDQQDMNPIIRYQIQASNPYLENKWNGTFDGVGQANLVLRILPKATDLTAAEAKQIEAEAKFIRGHHFFEAKKMWKNIPYIDETVVDFKVPNTAGADYVNIWPQIEADLKFAYDNLDESKPNAGRINKWGAAAYLAKAFMYQNKFAEAKALFDLIIANGKNAKGQKYDLLTNYNDNFRVTSENSFESVFAIQSSYGDGSNTNGNYDNALNFPHGGSAAEKPGACCGFFQPSQSMVNSFKVTPAGLPMPDTYNAAPSVTSDETLASSDPFVPYAGPVDPRLDWTVGRRGIPYYDWGVHPGRSWIRFVSYGGPYSPKKNTFYKSDVGTTAGVVGWGWANTALNYTIMRFSDVLLMAAEAEVEVGTLAKAFEYVNRVRTRANNSKVMNGAVPAANYVVAPYPAVWGTKEDARKAVRFERKLELGMEGHRFFDLVRWGIADVELNAYLAFDGALRPAPIGGATFRKGINEYFPIPAYAISQSIKDGQPTLKQNPGY